MVLHIVNGDSTKELLREAGLTEPIIVWREMLCEGPCVPTVGSTEFWEKRAQFIGEYIPGHSKLDYWNKIVKELDRIKDFLKQTDEIVLWFEYDLFCQINLLACLTYLGELNLVIPISLVLPEFEGENQLKSLGYHEPGEILNLLPEKKRVSQKEMLLAKKLWNLWCAHNYDKMIDVLKKKTTTFIYLDKAIQQHVLYRTRNEQGKTMLEIYISSLIADPEMNKKSIVKKCLTNDSFQWLGYGDLQYEKVYESLI